MTENFQLIVTDDLPNEFCEIFTKFYRTSKNNKISFMATGGSQANLCYPPLSNRLHEITSEGASVDVYLGDERLVPLWDSASNTRLIESLLISGSPNTPIGLGFFSPVFGAAPNIELLTTTNVHQSGITDDRTQAALTQIATNYDKVLGKATGSRFIHLGLGPDGHIASLFPKATDYGITYRNCKIAYDLNGLNKNLRLSMTIDYINRADLVVLSVATAARGKVLAQILENPNNFPAGQIESEKLIILVNRDAASTLVHA